MKEFKKIITVYNPISGRGKAKLIAEAVASELNAKGREVTLYQSKPDPLLYLNDLDLFKKQDLIVSIGGDGTILSLLTLIVQAGVPLYMIPAGNESLFAKLYHMNGNLSTLEDALKGGDILKQYYGVIEINGTSDPFYIMASMGLDAMTVKNIGKRTGGINNFIYVKNGIKALMELKHPEISVTIDGKLVIDHKRGYPIIANASSYAHDLCLVPQASPDKHSLEFGFLENANLWHEFQKAYWMSRRQPAKLPMAYFTGQKIELTLHGEDYPLQVDGEYFKLCDIKGDTKVTFTISDEPIEVLRPPCNS